MDTRTLRYCIVANRPVGSSVCAAQRSQPA
jgi:hypothetical protein